MRPLAEVLTERGTDLLGWKLSRAVDVSADGMSIVGTGIRPDRKIGNWAASFAPQPRPPRTASVALGPSGLLLTLFAVAAIGALWRQRLTRVPAQHFIFFAKAQTNSLTKTHPEPFTP
jgi:hypothetical protein